MMAVADKGTFGPQQPEMSWLLQPVQQKALRLMLPALCLAGLAALGFPYGFRDPVRAEWLGIILWLLAGLMWTAHHFSPHAGGWAIALGSLLAILLVTGWAGISQATVLLTLPAGLAALTMGVPAGLALGGATSALLVLAPPSLLPADTRLRLFTFVGLWGTFALVWLTLHPLLTAVEWSWASYEESRRQLERARDYQVQLKQTLKDLADANVQLTRLNRLAQGLRQAAEEARHAKEQFVANVSHELRTPLNMIIGFSEMITSAPEAYGSFIPPALKADLAVILRNSQHLSALIDDVLDLSQIEARRMALTREHTTLQEIVQAAVVAVQPLFEGKGLYLHMSIPTEIELFCDRTRIREVLLNLLSNAGRFTTTGGVTVEAWQESNEVVVRVTDTGPGIAAEEQDRLFRPFQQLNSTIAQRYGGTGLGLSISKSFVELHGGRMWVESEPGKGTSFFFSLPTETPAPPQPSATRWLTPQWEYEGRMHRPAQPLPIARPKLLVVEAGNTLSRLLARYLQDAEVQSVSSLEAAATELASTTTQALIVNDPDVGAALTRLQDSALLPPGTPALVCSLPGPLEAAEALGATDYLLKPVTREGLLAALDRLGLQSGTVLVVDDESDAQRLFWRMLANCGRDYRVLTASNGQQALHILRHEHPDVLLLDLIMPEMDGFRLLEVRSHNAELQRIPAIILSARDPTGQPVVSGAVAATLKGGLAVPQLLTCINTMRQILAVGDGSGHPTPPADPPG